MGRGSRVANSKRQWGCPMLWRVLAACLFVGARAACTSSAHWDVEPSSGATSAAWRGPLDGVAWLVTVAVADEAERGDVITAAAVRTIVRLRRASRVSPRVVVVVVDGRGETNVTAWSAARPGALAKLARLAHLAARAPALVELVEGDSCFGIAVVQRAFVGQRAAPKGDGYFKNTFAYLWGLARCAELARYAVHLDDDVGLVPGDVDDATTHVTVFARTQRGDALAPTPVPRRCVRLSRERFS